MILSCKVYARAVTCFIFLHLPLMFKHIWIICLALIEALNVAMRYWYSRLLIAFSLSPITATQCHTVTTVTQ